MMYWNELTRKRALFSADLILSLSTSIRGGLYQSCDWTKKKTANWRPVVRTIWPMIELRTWRETRLAVGRRWWMRWYGPVRPMVTAMGRMMKRSMYRNCADQ